MTESTPDAAAGQAVDPRDLLVLARIAGLPIGDNRAAGLARELANANAAVREVDALLADQPTLALRAFGPYDPAWLAAAPAVAPAPARDDSAGTTGAGR